MARGHEMITLLLCSEVQARRREDQGSVASCARMPVCAKEGHSGPAVRSQMVGEKLVHVLVHTKVTNHRTQ